MTELQAISTEVCYLMEGTSGLTNEQAEHLNTLSDSMQFYIENGDEAKCLYVAKETRAYLLNITS